MLLIVDFALTNFIIYLIHGWNTKLSVTTELILKSYVLNWRWQYVDLNIYFVSFS